MPRRNAAAAVTKFLHGNFGGWKGAQPAAPPAVIRARQPVPLVDWLPYSSQLATTYRCKAGGIIYGVYQPQAQAPKLYSFDPDALAWSHVTDFPAGLLAEEVATAYFFAHPLVSDGTDIYVVVIRANASAGLRLSRLWKWDGATWTQMTDPPGGAGTHMNGPVGYANGGIFLFGGLNAAGSSRIATTSRYDIGGNSWSAKTSRPTAASVGAESLETLTYDDDIIYIHGENTGSYSPVVRAYSESGDSWSTRANVPATSAWPLVDKLDDGRAVLIQEGLAHQVWLWDETADSYEAYGPLVPNDGVQIITGQAIGQKAYVELFLSDSFYNVADF